jgi:hypothetical protein
MNQIKIGISEKLLGNGCAKKAAWWNQYMKGEIPFIGVGIPEIRQTFLNRDRELAFAEMPMNRQVALVNGLMRGQYAEE